MSTITKERVSGIASGEKCYTHDDVLELARIALASLEAEEPGRNPVLAYADSYRDMAKRGVETIPVWSVITDLERNIAPLFTAAPATVDKNPLREFAMEYIESWELGMAGDSSLLASARKAIADSEILQPAPVSVPDDYFSSLVAAARVRADKAMRKFPQPNYVLNKVAEESGEVIKAVIHFTEGREEWQNVEGEIIDNLAMLIRLVMEGDQVIGFTPPDACRAAMLQGAENAGSPTTMKTAPALDSSPKIAESTSGNSPVIPDCSCRTCRPVTMTEMRFVVCPDCGNKRCPHANDHRNACTGSNEPGQEGSAYPAAPQQEVKP